jgi:hypothetical protein
VIAPRSNTALAGENERMFHRVERVGAPGARAEEVSPSAELVAEGEDWCIREPGRSPVPVPFEQVRLSVSWKAEVFADAAEARVADAQLDDLEPGSVWRIFRADLARRGIEADPGSEPHSNPAWIAALGAAYTRTPARFPSL